MNRAAGPHRVSSVSVDLPSAFYREEFLRHRECLAAQREYFSERAVTTADEALALVLDQLDQICQRDGADQLIGDLLKTFNAVTGLSNWSDPTQLH
jgi:hypothetical protein